MEDPLAELVIRSQRGDRAAFAELVRLTHEQVYNLAYQFLSNAQEAEDLTQEVYLRVWRALSDFRGEARFRTWLYRITANTCINRRRRLRGQLETTQDGAVMERLPSTQENPDAAVITNDRKKRLWDAVRCLPDKYRLVLSLFYQEQLSYDEVADTLALPLGTVKAQLNRARQALASILRKDERDGM